VLNGTAIIWLGLTEWPYPSVEQVSLHRETRRAHRFPFLATAEVAEGCGEGVAARVSELSIFGCHLLMSNPLSEGASILLKIRTKTEFFQCHATVVHSNQSHGIGVVFRDVSPPFRTVLQAWLLEAMRETSTHQIG
jgi:hypothetical protein